MQASDLVRHVSGTGLVGEAVEVRTNRDGHALSFCLLRQFMPIGVGVAPVHRFDSVHAQFLEGLKQGGR